MGGCAPYSSLAGMFRSSTLMMHFLPTGGPSTPFRRLSSFESMMSYREGAFSKSELIRIKHGLNLTLFVV